MTQSERGFFEGCRWVWLRWSNMPTLQKKTPSLATIYTLDCRVVKTNLVQSEVRFFIKNPLTSTWVRLLKTCAFSGFSGWLWHPTLHVPSVNTGRATLLSLPSRVKRYSLSRGPMARKKKSREQTYTANATLVLRITYTLNILQKVVSNPHLWWWTMVDLLQIAGCQARGVLPINPALLGVTNVCLAFNVPVLGFIGVQVV
jgi:hypothetical protein